MLVAKNLPAKAGGVRDAGSIPGSGRYPGGGHGNLLQCSCLENPMDRGAWWATIHRVAKGQTRLKQLSTHRTCHLFLCQCEVKATQLCLTLCNPIDYRVHGILQARILEWLAFPFSRGPSQPRDWTQVSCIAGEFFTSWATREAPRDWDLKAAPTILSFQIWPPMLNSMCTS